MKVELIIPVDGFDFRDKWNSIIKNDTHVFSLNNWVNDDTINSGKIKRCVLCLNTLARNINMGNVN